MKSMKYIISIFVVLVVFIVLLFMFIIPSCEEKRKANENVTSSWDNLVSDNVNVSNKISDNTWVNEDKTITTSWSVESGSLVLGEKEIWTWSSDSEGVNKISSWTADVVENKDSESNLEWWEWEKITEPNPKIEDIKEGSQEKVLENKVVWYFTVNDEWVFFWEGKWMTKLEGADSETFKEIDESNYEDKGYKYNVVEKEYWLEINKESK